MGRDRRILCFVPALSFCLLTCGCAVLSAGRADAGPEGAGAKTAADKADSRAPFKPVTPEEAETRAAYFNSELLMAGDRFDDALKILEDLASRDKAAPEAITALARAQMRNRNVDKAVEALTRCIAANPTYIPAYQLRARIYRLRGEVEKAVADLEAALAADPNNPDLLEEINTLELRSIGQGKDLRADPLNDGRIKKLIDVNQRLLALRKGSERILPLLVLTSIYSQTGESEKAITSAKEVVELRPLDIRGHLALAEAYESAKRPEDALKAYKQALLIEPDNASIRAKMADLISQTGAPGGLMGFYEDLAKSFPRVREIQQAYGDELVKAGEWDKAINLYTAALALWPEDARLRAMLARSYLMVDRRSDAEPILKELMDDPTVNTQEMNELVQSLRVAHKLDAVIDILSRLAATQKDGPEKQRVLLQMAGAQIEAGQKDKAAATLEGLVAARPDLFLAVAMLGGLYSDAGRYDDAHNLYARVGPQTSPATKDDLTQLEAELYRKEGRPDKAMELLRGLLAKGDAVSPSLVQLALQILDAQKDYAEAHKIIDRFIADSSGEPRIQGRRMKSYLYWRQRDYKAAAALLEEVHKEAPDNYQVFSFLVEVYMDSREYDKAGTLIESASEVYSAEPFSTELHLLRARTFKAQNKPEKAVAVIESLIASKPGEEQYYLIAGEYYHDAGRLDDAERVLRKAIELNPDNAEAYNALGYFFAEANVKLDEALRLVSKALEMNPGAGHILDSLGWVHYQRAEFDKAVEALETAVAKLKDAPDPLVLEHLGDAYRKAGKSERARATYAEALKMSPDNSELKSKLGVN